MPIKRRGVVLSGPSGGGDPPFIEVCEPLRENFEIGVLKSAFQCILSNHGLSSFLKENFTEKKPNSESVSEWPACQGRLDGEIRCSLVKSSVLSRI